MYELKKIWKVLTSKSVGIGPSSYDKRIYRAAVSQSLRDTGLENADSTLFLKVNKNSSKRVVVSIRLVLSVVDGRLRVSPKPTKVDHMKWDRNFAEAFLFVLDAQSTH